MNREIKFRVFGNSGIMKGWEVLKKLHIGTVFQIAEGYHVMQYTGLKDKNGKEIYEGDLISENGGEPLEVIWQFHSVRWLMQSTLIGRTYREMAYDYAQMNYEVIGNIYENPKLLKQEEAKND